MTHILIADGSEIHIAFQSKVRHKRFILDYFQTAIKTS